MQEASDTYSSTFTTSSLIVYLLTPQSGAPLDSLLATKYLCQVSGKGDHLESTLVEAIMNSNGFAAHSVLSYLYRCPRASQSVPIISRVAEPAKEGSTRSRVGFPLYTDEKKFTILISSRLPGSTSSLTYGSLRCSWKYIRKKRFLRSYLSLYSVCPAVHRAQDTWNFLSTCSHFQPLS